MKIRIVSHFSKETGKFLGQEIQAKPFWCWPVWQKVNGGKKYADDAATNYDLRFLLAVSGMLDYKNVYD